MPDRFIVAKVGEYTIDIVYKNIDTTYDLRG